MIKISSISILGFLVMIIPFTGFPTGFKMFLYIVFGLAILVLSILIRRELHEVLKTLHPGTTPQNDTFKESEPPKEQK